MKAIQGYFAAINTIIIEKSLKKDLIYNIIKGVSDFLALKGENILMCKEFGNEEHILLCDFYEENDTLD